MVAAPRDAGTRVADTLRRLETDVDLWLATAPAGGGPPGLVPLSFDWDGETLLLSTPRSGPAGMNLRTTGRCRAALGELRDVVMVDATGTEHDLAEVPDERWERYARRTGWDPRRAGQGYAAYLLRPVEVQAWREVDELAGRTIMRAGVWTADPATSPS